jgi:nucleoside 2-deoxyribosyltransferase
MPAGKSCHLEAGYMIGQGKKVYILFDKELKRWDIMVQFATDIFFNIKDLIKELKKLKNGIS